MAVPANCSDGAWGFEWVQLEKGKAVIRVLLEEPIPAVLCGVGLVGGRDDDCWGSSSF